jgi:hypothetical protein
MIGVRTLIAKKILEAKTQPFFCSRAVGGEAERQTEVPYVWFTGGRESVCV